MTKLGLLIKTARERTGKSARTVSAEAGLSPAYVSRLESGTLEPSLKAFAAIVGVLGMSQGEVMVCLAVEVLDES